MNKCDGLFITGYDRHEFNSDQVEKILSKVRDDYEFYKSGGNLKLPAKIGGKSAYKLFINLNKLYQEWWGGNYWPDCRYRK